MMPNRHGEHFNMYEFDLVIKGHSFLAERIFIADYGPILI